MYKGLVSTFFPSQTISFTAVHRRKWCQIKQLHVCVWATTLPRSGAESLDHGLKPADSADSNSQQPQPARSPAQLLYDNDRKQIANFCSIAFSSLVFRRFPEPSCNGIHIPGIALYATPTAVHTFPADEPYNIVTAWDLYGGECWIMVDGWQLCSNPMALHFNFHRDRSCVRQDFRTPGVCD